MSGHFSFDELDSNPKQKNKISNSKEHEYKELLYSLFYEIKSEILGCKIEIEEEEYQEKVRTTTIPNLVKYIHESIQILLEKKIEDIKKSNKIEEKSSGNGSNLTQNDKVIYENIIKNLEAKERCQRKIIFQNKLQKEAMENKIGEYMEMEDVFEEMKAKMKYEDGRFLENDRKDNEIIIVRSENSNLKKCINKLEAKIKL